MEFSRQEYWSGLPFLPPGDLPNPGTEPRSPALQADSLPSDPPGKPHCLQRKSQRLSPPQKKLEIISEVGKVTGYQINIYVSIVFL